MSRVEVNVKTFVRNSFRVSALASMFGYSAKQVDHHVVANIPDIDSNWHIGAIVGPSGSGKSLLAKEYGNEHYYISPKWKDDAVVDEIGGESIEQVIEMFTSLGFSSVPSWCKPYKVLSCGERMRVDLARSLLSNTGLVVFDEFTSTVDRHCARIIALSLGKTLRRQSKIKFVAVACHDDFLADLCPDWILRVPNEHIETTGGAIERKPFRFVCERSGRESWEMFRQHHYLDTTLHCAARCYSCTDIQTKAMIGFAAILNCAGWKGRDRVSRIVVLPEYQGVGIGTRFLNAVANEHAKSGRSLSIVTSHPGFIKSLYRNKRWVFRGRASLGTFVQGKRRRISSTIAGSMGCFLERSSSSFLYTAERA